MPGLQVISTPWVGLRPQCPQGFNIDLNYISPLPEYPAPHDNSFSNLTLLMPHAMEGLTPLALRLANGLFSVSVCSFD